MVAGLPRAMEATGVSQAHVAWLAGGVKTHKVFFGGVKVFVFFKIFSVIEKLQTNALLVFIDWVTLLF